MEIAKRLLFASRLFLLYSNMSQFVSLYLIFSWRIPFLLAWVYLIVNPSQVCYSSVCVEFPKPCTFSFNTPATGDGG